MITINLKKEFQWKFPLMLEIKNNNINNKCLAQLKLYIQIQIQ